MGEIFISSLKFSWVNPEIFRDENEIFAHENENFAHEMKISPMKFFVREGPCFIVESFLALVRRAEK